MISAGFLCYADDKKSYYISFIDDYQKLQEDTNKIK